MAQSICDLPVEDGKLSAEMLQQCLYSYRKQQGGARHGTNKDDRTGAATHQESFRE